MADHGEVFTAKREVNAMLDLIETETEQNDSQFKNMSVEIEGGFLMKSQLRKMITDEGTAQDKIADKKAMFAVLTFQLIL